MQVVQTNGDLFGKCTPLIFLCIGSVDFSSKGCKGRSGLFHVYFAVLAMEGDLSSFSSDSDDYKGSKCKESAKFCPLHEIQEDRVTGKKALLRATSSDLLGYNAAMNESSLKTDTTICYLGTMICVRGTS